MATAYKAPAFQGQQMPTQVGPNTFNFKIDIATLVASFPGFIINDTLEMVQIPNGAMLDDFYIDMPALDSSTGVVWSVGDNVNSSHGGAGAGGFATAQTIGRSSTGGTLRAGATGYVAGAIPWIYAVPRSASGVDYLPSTGIQLLFKCTTAPTGTAASTGIIKGWVKYTLLTSTEGASGTAPQTGGYL